MIYTIEYSKEAEKTSPLTDVVVVRKVDRLDLDGEILRNVEVTLNPVSPDYLINDKYKVKVKVTDFRGKKIWKRNIRINPPRFVRILINCGSSHFEDCRRLFQPPPLPEQKNAPAILFVR